MADMSSKVKEFKQVFLRLVTLGNGNIPNTRRIATHAEIGADNWQKIVVPLSTERLLKTTVDEKTQEETVEVIHETLIQSWQRLTGWIEDYRHELERIAEIEAAAIKWDRNKRSKQDLWGGKKLKEALKFSKDRERLVKLESIANDFLVAGSKKQILDQIKLWGLGMTLPALSLFYIQRELSIQFYRLEIGKIPIKECNKNLESYVLELSKIDPSQLDLHGRNLKCIDILKVNYSGADLSDADLSNTILDHVKFKGANLSSVNLEGSRLFDNDLRNVNLKFAKINGTVLFQVDLTGADLTGSHLTSADVSDINLTSANLTDVALWNTTLEGIKFKGTNLLRADLKGANFPKATNLTTEQIKTAKNWDKATYDETFCKELGLKYTLIPFSGTNNRQFSPAWMVCKL
jgi:uncharacterized protein YjbI with pentapeptide repeats